MTPTDSAEPTLAAPRHTALRRLVEDPAAFAVRLPEEPRMRRAADDFSDLFDLGTIDELLTDRALRRPAFRVIRDGEQVPDTACLHRSLLYPDVADPHKISRLLAEGATLVFQGLQELTGPLAEFARRLAHDLGRPVNVNAYVTPAGSQGFGDHYDTQDSFIVQIHGSKRWTLSDPVVARPLSHESGRKVTAGAPGRTLTLTPGDCLWLPRGWVHSARSTDTASVHLTISLYEWTGHWAWTRIADRATDLPGRFPLSTDFFRDRSAAEKDMATLRAELIDWLTGADDSALVDLVRAAGAPEFPSPLRHPFRQALADGVDEDTEYAVNAHAVLGAEIRGDRLVLTLGARGLTVPATMAPILADLLSRDRFRPKGLTPPLDPAQRDHLLARLQSEGVLTPASGSHT
ncbi:MULTISPECIES: cupin domain-containing protein [Streptomyces]|uniref:cupin domain-containing protein n=1 Tax=Streptomyces TaxID=1883 RepID=UPI001E4FAE4D|nr:MULTISPECIES: cupin domain-containing protein [Streptomyces]UFQ14044.1 cupin domain-containing protein [Streptomyces huasconensis]WCL83642.1 cupin domain-containing protein [Streptomyces sp. JCM 35825]